MFLPSSSPLPTQSISRKCFYLLLQILMQIIFFSNRRRSGQPLPQVKLARRLDKMVLSAMHEEGYTYFDLKGFHFRKKVLKCTYFQLFTFSFKK